MSRPLFLLSLFIALAAAPARLAEAASDLARHLAEFDSGVDVEEADGGVADDSGETIKAEKTCTSLLTANELALPGFFELCPCPRGLAARPPADAPEPIPENLSRRLSALECYRC